MNHDVFYHDLIDEDETTRVAGWTASLLQAGDLLVLCGDLGAGKTFFSRSLCYARGLDPDEAVTSPTFALVHEYPLEVPILHADLYRLGEPEEVEELGLEARRDEAILLVEWGAPFVDLLGGQAVYFEFAIAPRSLTVRGDGARAKQIVSGLSDQRGSA